MGLSRVLVVVALSWILARPYPSEGKLCCDPDCRKPISYGRTQQRYITKDGGFLSYPQSAIVSVLAKKAYLTENGDEFWEAEIQGKKGLISSTAINEMTYKCDPQEFAAKEVEEKLEDGGNPGAYDGQQHSSSSSSDNGKPADQVSPGQLPPTTNQEYPSPDSQSSTDGLHGNGDGTAPHEKTTGSDVGNDISGDEAQLPRNEQDGGRLDERLDGLATNVGRVGGAGNVNSDPNGKLPQEWPQEEQFEQKEEPNRDFYSDDTASNYHRDDRQETHQTTPIPPPMATPIPTPTPPSVTEEMLATLSPHLTKDNMEGRVQEDVKVTLVDGGTEQVHVPPAQGNLPPLSAEGSDPLGNGANFKQPVQDEPKEARESYYAETAVGGNLDKSSDDSQKPQEAARGDTNLDESVDGKDDGSSYSEEHHVADHLARDKQFDDSRLDQARDDERPPVEAVNTDSQSDKRDGYDVGEDKLKDRREGGYAGGENKMDESERVDEEEKREEEMDGDYDDDDDYWDDGDHYWDDVEEPKYTTRDGGQLHESQTTSKEPWEEPPPKQPSDEDRANDEKEEEKDVPVVARDNSNGDPEEAVPHTTPWPSEPETPPPFSETPPTEGLPSDAPPTEEALPPSSREGDAFEQVGAVPDSNVHSTDNAADLHSLLSESRLHPSLHPSRADSATVPTADQVQSSHPPVEEKREQEATFDPPGTIVDGTTYPPDVEEGHTVEQTTYSHVSIPIPTPTPIADSGSSDQDGHARTLEENAAETRQMMEDLSDRRQESMRYPVDDEGDDDDNGDFDDDKTPHGFDKRAGFDSGDYDGGHIPQDQREAQQPEATPATIVEDTPTTTSNAHSDVTDYGVEATPNPVEDSPTQEPTVVDQSQAETNPHYVDEPEVEEERFISDTPTAPPTYSSFEEPPPPPKASYSCHDDYVPMPGHDGGGWMAYHEKVRGRVRDLVLQSLPGEWSNWVCQNRPVMGVVFTSIACFSLFAPLLIIWCLSGRTSRQKIKQVQLKLANYRKLEDDLSKALSDKSVVERKLREGDDQRQDMQDRFSLQKQDIDRLTREKGEIEAHYQSVTGALTKAQHDITQYLANTEQLNSQIANLQSQITAVVSEREGALQQSTNLSAVIQDLEQKVQGLEAQKDQLEEDRYTSQTALQELQSQHEQVMDELQKTAEEREQLRSDLSSSTSELEAKMASITEKDEELQTLRSCLSQLTEQAATVEEGTGREEVDDGGEGEGKEEEEGEAIVSEKGLSQLEKIQAMLDTTKVQLELRETTEERDRLLAELKEKSASLEQQIADNEQLNAAYTALESKEQETSFQLKELELKMKGVKEYFQEKERELHKRIEVGEVSRMRYEQLESEAQEKASIADQERQRERQELVELRDQITDIEKSYSSQIKNTELRAGDAIASLRRTEQELRQANREITSLRRRLSEFENAPPRVMKPIPAHAPGGYLPMSRARPPSTGPPPPREVGYQPPRPISAPRLDPRTSSPTGSETRDALPSLPPMSRAAPPGGFHKSQSSSAVLNASLPPLGTASSRAEDHSGPRSRNDVSFPGRAPSSTSSLTNLPVASQTQGTSEQRSGERLPPSRQPPPPQAHLPSASRPLKTPPIHRSGPTPPPAPGRPMPPPPQGRVPRYPPQPYPGGAPPGGRMYRGPPPALSSGHPYPPPPGGPGPYPPAPRQPMAPPSARGPYPPQQNSGMVPPRPRVRTPGPPPPPGGYTERPGQPQPPSSSWQHGQAPHYQQQAPPPPGNAPPTRSTGAGGVDPSSQHKNYTEADVV